MQAEVGIIGGGRMGEAMIRGFIQSKILSPSKIQVLEVIPERVSFLKTQYGIRPAKDLEEVCKTSSVIILAVKPQNISQVLKALKGHINARHLVISIAAGIPIRLLTKELGKKMRIIRSMPNTPALALQGITALCAGGSAKTADLKKAEELFKVLGETVKVEEQHMDAVTGLSGSGPAYIFLVAEALMDAGVGVGLPREVSRKLVVQTLLGSAVLLSESGGRPVELKEQVTSPGGTTIAGLHVLERGGIKGLFMDAVRAATERSRELGEVYR